ncbi:NAD(P)H-dependent oxidoreductase subunit E [Myxococcota bacterium]|nr:NAD(P)H-dependent oxidoreductase subunit E [Myxococcota bacterium]
MTDRITQTTALEGHGHGTLPVWKRTPEPDAGVDASVHARLEFSDAAKERLAWLRTRYPDGYQRALVLPVLSMAQREFGWVSPQVIAFVADAIPVPRMWVEEVATFYTMYNKRPIGRHHLQVCTNVCCAVVGGEQLLEYVCRKLGVHPGETTADGRFTVIGAECLGACGYAPMMQVNDDYHENLRSRAQVDALLERLAAEPDRVGTDPHLALGPGTGPGRMLPRNGPALKAGGNVHTPEGGH